MSKTGLCILFNHPFPEQIETLRAIYGTRFARMLFLLPFCELEAEDVYTVYRGAFQFDGMIVDTRDKIKEYFKDCEYITFLHNDCLLNPTLDEKNLIGHLELNSRKAFTAQCNKLGGPMDGWAWLYRLPHRLLYPMDPLLGLGAQKAKEYLPDLKQIQERCIAGGFDASSSKITPPQRAGQRHYFEGFISTEIFRVNRQPETGVDLGYPLMSGYSDFFSLPMEKFSDWVRVLGLLSALDLFEEITVPTSLVWTFGSVSTSKSLHLKTVELWGADRQMASDIPWALQRLKESTFFHPMKLNRLSDTEHAELLKAYIEGM